MNVFFDLSRSIRRAAHSTLTGIDRVDLAYARELPALCETVTYLAGRGRPRVISPARVSTFLAESARPTDDPVSTALFSHLAKSAWDGKEAVHLSEHYQRRQTLLGNAIAALSLRVSMRALPKVTSRAVYLNTSHSGLDDTRYLQALKIQGIRIVVVLHDLIPIDFPEFCRNGEDRRHCARLANIVLFADLVVTVSAYTRERFLAWSVERKTAPPTTVVVPLATEHHFLSATVSSRDLSPLPYFVCLGTIEARKNHSFLLLVWRRLVERLGDSCPRLVLVGRRGWKIELPLDLLRLGKGLSSAVVEVADLSDRGVVALMAGAHGLVQPSLAEGFGLPLVEAGALGIPVIASDIPAHREIAPVGTLLLDPLDAPAWERSILAVAGLPRNRFPRTTSSLRHWRTHVAETVDAIEQNIRDN
ncbi:glycosyltransferase family 4 protein [Labrys okinawensis]|uniref:glycosyltransferase family 4 protein n=1 Tax=Labrys okinawensis TaxID=346911 RepID=UPI0039BCDCD8